MEDVVAKNQLDFELEEKENMKLMNAFHFSLESKHLVRSASKNAEDLDEEYNQHSNYNREEDDDNDEIVSINKPYNYPTHLKSNMDTDSSVSMEASMVAEHYSSRKNINVHERAQSPIFELKQVNNWVKSALINIFSTYCTMEHPTLTTEGLAILDLCGGKGGDLKKFFVDQRLIRTYVIADIATGSVMDSVDRFNKVITHSTPRTLFISANLCLYRLHNILDPRITFDMTSCQFSFHYSFASESMARSMLQNAADRLRPGGYFFCTIPDARILVEKLRTEGSGEFGNSAYRVRFDDPSKHGNAENYSNNSPVDWKNITFSSSKPFGIRYNFYLMDAVDEIPEYLVHFGTLCALAADYGLRPVLRENFHSFIAGHANPNVYTSKVYSTAFAPSTLEKTKINALNTVKQQNMELLRRLKVFPNGIEFPKDQWEALGIYCVVAFQKIPYSELDVPIPKYLHFQSDNVIPISVNATVGEALDQMKAECTALLERGIVHVPSPFHVSSQENGSITLRYPRLFIKNKVGEMKITKFNVPLNYKATVEDDYIELNNEKMLYDGDVWDEDTAFNASVQDIEDDTSDEA